MVIDAHMGWLVGYEIRKKKQINAKVLEQSVQLNLL